MAMLTADSAIEISRASNWYIMFSFPDDLAIFQQPPPHGQQVIQRRLDLQQPFGAQRGFHLSLILLDQSIDFSPFAHRQL